MNNIMWVKISLLLLWLKLKIKKVEYSISGYYWTKKYKGNFYLINSSKQNILHTYTHHKNKAFYTHSQSMEPTTGVVYFETKNKELPYWVIGVLDKKIIK